MASYNRDEARDWARDHLRGVINVVIPSFTNDLLGINEAAVRHDVRKQFEFGFDGAARLRSRDHPAQYREFCEIAADEAKGGQLFFHHSSWSDLDHALAALEIADGTPVPNASFRTCRTSTRERKTTSHEYIEGDLRRHEPRRDALPDVPLGLSPRIHRPISRGL